MPKARDGGSMQNLSWFHSIAGFSHLFVHLVLKQLELGSDWPP